MVDVTYLKTNKLNTRIMKNKILNQIGGSFAYPRKKGNGIYKY